MTNPKPGNEPDPGDMSVEPDLALEKARPNPLDPLLAEEEQAAKLGDFA